MYIRVYIYREKEKGSQELVVSLIMANGFLCFFFIFIFVVFFFFHVSQLLCHQQVFYVLVPTFFFTFFYFSILSFFCSRFSFSLFVPTLNLFVFVFIVNSVVQLKCARTERARGGGKKCSFATWQNDTRILHACTVCVPLDAPTEHNKRI